MKGTMPFSAWCGLRTDSKTPSRLDCRYLASAIFSPQLEKLSRKSSTVWLGWKLFGSDRTRTEKKRLKFVQDVSTRWNISLDMMERLLVLRPNITAVLRDSSVTKKDDKSLNLSTEQYDLMESLIGILMPLKDATTLLSAEKPVTILYVLHFVLELASVLETKDSDSVTVSTVKAAMLKDLNTRSRLVRRPSR